MMRTIEPSENLSRSVTSGRKNISGRKKGRNRVRCISFIVLSVTASKSSGYLVHACPNAAIGSLDLIGGGRVHI